MNRLQITKDFVQQSLPSGNVVAYGPKGSAIPFVLTDKALSIFRFLQKIGSIDFKGLTQHMAPSGITPEEVRHIVEDLQREGVVSKRDILLPIAPRDMAISPPSALSFWIHVTSRCNLCCDYCYIVKKKDDMTAETLESFLGMLIKTCEVQKLKTVGIKFAGGEPLLCFPFMRHFVKRVKAVFATANIRAVFSVITNGTLLTPKICRFLVEEGFWVSVSLDGIGKHNKARHYPNGQSSFYRVVLGLDMLAQYDIRPLILTVVTNDNVHGLSALCEVTRMRGLKLDLILCRDVNNDGSIVLDLQLMTQALIPQLSNWVLSSKEDLPQLGVSTLKLNGKHQKFAPLVEGTLH